MASYSMKRFTNPTQLGTSASTIYTAGTGVTATVKEILVANVSGAAQSISLHFVPSGGIASSSNLMVPALSVSSTSLITIDLNQVLNAGDTIQAFASATTSINVMVSGFEAE